MRTFINIAYKNKLVVALTVLLFWSRNINATNYLSSAVTQITTAATAGVDNQEILRLSVAGSGGGAAASVCSIQFTMQNTDNADIQNAKLYYTGTSTTFVTTTLLGTVGSPSGTITFTINHQVIGNSTYYYWLAYDIKGTAPACNSFDAFVPANGLVTFNAGPCGAGTNRTPTSNDPAGSRTIAGIGCQVYCSVTGNASTSGYLSGVVFNTINRTSVYDGGYYNGTGTSTNVEKGNSYDLTVTRFNASTYRQYTAAWIDFDNDGFFTTAGENVMLADNFDATAGNVARTVSVVVPAGAVTGSTRLRVLQWYSDAAPTPPDNTGCDITGATCCNFEYEDYTVNIVAASSMAYSSSTVAQASTANLTAGSANMEILRIEVVTTGSLSPISATDFTLNTAGSTNASNDIATARLYYTGTSSTFATTTQVGSDVANPNGGFSINAARTLANGTNYFWLAYDIRSTATTSNVVDGTCTVIRVDGVDRTPTVTNPAGSRPIVDPSYCAVTGNDNTTGWVSGVVFNTISRTSGWDGGYYNGTGTSTNVCKGSSYDLTVTRWNTNTYRKYTAAWIDFNRNGDFTDAGENVMLADSWDATNGDLPRTVSVTIPAGAASGTVRLRVVGWYTGASNPPDNTGCDVTGDACCNFEYEDYTVNILSNADMTYTSSTVVQASTATVMQGSTGNEILRVEVVTGGGCGNPLSATSFTFNTTGSTNPSGDITQARLYYTGNSSTFALSNQLGEVMFDPNGGFTTVGVSQTLANGTNYFWLTYNIDPMATATNVVDAQCTSIDISGARTPTVTNPAGTRQIVALAPGAYCAVTGTGVNNYIKNVSFNSINNTTLGDCAGTSNYCDYTAISTTVYYGMSYELVVDAYSNTKSAGLWYAASSVYIDWNRDGDFGDANETVLTGVSGPQGSIWNPYRIAGDVTIPSNVVLGSARMRVVTWFSTTTAPASCGALANAEIEDYTVLIAELDKMVYVSCNSTQNNLTSVDAGTYSNEILGIQVVTSGVVNPLNVSSFTVPTTGTSTLTDITNAKLWFTSNDPSFASTTQLGSTIAVPGASLTFSGFTQTLITGANYFWVTYDVICGVTSAQIDAGCTSVTVSGSAKTPTTTAPAGNRAIIPSFAMAYISSTCTQNSLSVAKGEVNQHIIGIEIVVNGCSSPMSTGDFSFTNSSTTPGDFSNARLFYTGTANVFSTTTLAGGPVAPAASFTIPSNTTLVSGTNYFWLTYDVAAGAACDPKVADARCNTVIVGGISRTPTLTNPAGSRTINCGAPYYSKGSLDASSLSSWSTTRDGLGAAPGSFSAGYDFYVQNGHSMTTSSAKTIPHVYMESGSKITASKLLTMTDLMISNGAIFEQTYKATTASYITNFYILSGGTWIHNNNGYLPGNNRQFDANSNQWFYQWGGGTFPTGTNWGNLLLNGTTTGNFILSNVFNTIQGDMEWRRIGSNNYLWSTSTEIIDVGGDLIFTGGWFRGMGGSAGGAKTLTINIVGDLVMSSGAFEDFIDGNTSNKSVLTIGGNVTISGGTFSYNNCPDALSQINMDGGTASVTWTQSGGTVILCNTNIKTTKVVTLSGTQMGSIATSRTITVENGGALMCSNYPVTGAGAFTMQDNSILGIGSAAGIVSAGASGNIQVTGTRTYHSGGHYIYYEGLTPQVTGVFTTTPTAATVRKLRVQKSLNSDLVSLSANLSVSDSTNLTQGGLGLNQKTLIITRNASDGIKRTNGYIISEHDAAINLSVVQWNMGATNSTFVYPFGVSSAADGYIPFTFNKLTGTANITVSTRTTITDLNTPLAGVSNVAAVNNMNRGTSDSSATSVVDRWWDITASAACTADLTFTYRGIENTLPAANPNYRTGTLGAQHWNGTIWETLVGTGTGVASGTGTVTVSGSDDFSPWILVAAPAPLPVELLTFSAKQESDFVRLEWVTASEKNSSYFVVQRGQDVSNFETEITLVKAMGNSSTYSSYFEYDKNPLPGTSYYRLQQFDNDGKNIFSDIVSVNINNSLRITSILPNPVVNSSVVSIYNPDETIYADFSVVNYTGQVMYQKTEKLSKGNNTILIDLKNLNKGLYFLKIENINFPAVIDKFIKQ